MNIKNNILIVKLDDYGRGIGYIDNKIIFISNTMIDEIVDVEIVSDTSKYYVGKVVNYVKKTINRIDVLCPYYDMCGGCNIMHMSYNDQIVYKKNKVENILYKFGNIKYNVDFISNDNIFNYRNKIDLKIINGLWGYYNSNTHNFVSIDKCLLVKESINKVILNKNLFNINNGNIVIRCNYNDEVLISITSLDKVSIDVNKLKNVIKLVGIVINDNIYYGDKFFYEEYNNRLFKVNYNSFFQVNYGVTNKIINYITDNISGSILLDLYCGVGFLGQVINKKFDKIYGIEINEDSIIDAVKNSKINKINNTFYLAGDASNAIKKIKDNIDCLIIDPPRSGLVKNMCNDVINFNACKIIYISCNPISLARDLKNLVNYYVIKKICCFDMFSQTYHVETVCVLERK